MHWKHENTKTDLYFLRSHAQDKSFKTCSHNLSWPPWKLRWFFSCACVIWWYDRNETEKRVTTCLPGSIRVKCCHASSSFLFISIFIILLCYHFIVLTARCKQAIDALTNAVLIEKRNVCTWFAIVQQQFNSATPRDPLRTVLALVK